MVKTKIARRQGKNEERGQGMEGKEEREGGKEGKKGRMEGWKDGRKYADVQMCKYVNEETGFHVSRNTQYAIRNTFHVSRCFSSF